MKCNSRERRARMTDDEFWTDVAESLQPTVFEPNPDDEDLSDLAESTECPECGSLGACAIDDEGRPLIHAIRGDAE